MQKEDRQVRPKEIESFLNSIRRLNEWEKGNEFTAKLTTTKGIKPKDII